MLARRRPVTPLSTRGACRLRRIWDGALHVGSEPPPFGTLLRQRATAGLTQEQLATRAGLSPDAIAALEGGRRPAPRGTTAALLADALGLDEQARAQFIAAARGSRGSGDAARSRAAAGTVPELRRAAWWRLGQPTPLVDRSQELATIVRRLPDEGVRLLTLTGPAGVGKTRLALAAAAQLAEDTHAFPDGVILVDLTPVREPGMVLGAIAWAVGLLEVGRTPLLDRLVEALAVRQRPLVVLDNFEQVLAAAAQLADLLPACPALARLVTSRVSLQLGWEQALRLAPLPVPDPREPLLPLDALVAVPSVELFIGRARAHRADFASASSRRRWWPSWRCSSTGCR